MTHIYTWRRGPHGLPNEVRAALFGRRCRIVCTGTLGSALLEFEDRTRVVTSRRAVRRVKEADHA